MPSWTASFTTPTAFNSPEKACESRKPAIKRLTQTQPPEPITMSVEAAAHDRAKYLLTIKRNERSPSREIAAHHQRNAHLIEADLAHRRLANVDAGFPRQMMIGNLRVHHDQLLPGRVAWRPQRDRIRSCCR